MSRRADVVSAKPDRLPCPVCGGIMLRTIGAIGGWVFGTARGELVWRTRPAVFYGCTSCEHCQE